MGNKITIEAGELRQRVEIFTPPAGLDAAGQPHDSKPSLDGWEHVGTRWAKIEPNLGSPYIQSDQIRNLTSHRITMRYFPSLTPRHRLKFGDRVFTVVAVLNSDERRIATVVAAQEVI